MAGRLDRLLPPGSAARARAGRLLDRLPDDIRARLRLPLLRNSEVVPLISACRAALDAAGDSAPDWPAVLAAASTVAPPPLVRQLRRLQRSGAKRSFELKLVTAFMALQGRNAAAQARYRDLLQDYDPSLPLPLPDDLTEAEFSGKGVGAGSLNSYRRVCRDGEWLFEKVYFTRHHELSSMLYAQEHLLPRLPRLRSPRLLHLAEGERLTAAYFVWEDLPERTARSVGSTVALLRGLREIDPAALQQTPDTMRDLSLGILAPLMPQAPAAIALAAPDVRLDLHRLWPEWGARIAAGPLGFAHGDPSFGNVLPERWVLDWDNCGLYPLGHDAAHYLALRHRRSSWKRIVALFEKRFLDPRAPEACWRGFLYFFLLFQMKLPRRHETQVPGALAELARRMAQ